MDKYYSVASRVDVLPGERIFVEIENFQLVIFRVGDQYFAIDDLCSHDDGPVGDGELEEFELTCPRHGAKFDIRTGKTLRMPAVKDIHSYPVQINGEKIEVGIPE